MWSVLQTSIYETEFVLHENDVKLSAVIEMD